MPSDSSLSIADFVELDSFATSSSPSSRENLKRAIDALRLRQSRIDGVLVAQRAQVLDALSSEGSAASRGDISPPVAAAALLHRLVELEAGELDGNESLRHRREEVTSTLNALLLKHPVLLDPSLVYQLPQGNDDGTRLVTALLHLRHYRFPSSADQVSRRELGLFAVHQSAASALSQRRTREFRIGEKSAQETFVATKKGVRGALLISLLELQSAGQTYGRPDILELTDRSQAKAFYDAVARVFWTAARGDSQSGTLDAAALVRAMGASPSPFLNDRLTGERPNEVDASLASTHFQEPTNETESCFQRALVRTIGTYLFAHVDVSVPKVGRLDRAGALGTTARATEMLVQMKLFETHAAAAHWLGEAVLGTSRESRIFPGPECTPDVAVGFLSALAAHGVRPEIDQSCLSLSDKAPKQVQELQPVARKIAATWQAAASQVAMELAISAEIAPPHAPLSRRSPLL